MNLFYQPRLPEGASFLDPEESRHCVKVLRKRNGDRITVTDGRGFFYDAVITHADPAKCLFEVRATTQAPAKNFFIRIAISPTKNADRMEWFVEKATELGVDRITLLNCRNTERTFKKTERLLKVAASAMKQSVKGVLPQIDAEVMPFGNAVETSNEDEKCIAHVDPENPLQLQDAVSSRKSYCVLIGPEGDFADEEVRMALHHGFRKVSLGPSRLRTETAGLAACHVLNLINTKSASNRPIRNE